MLKGLEVSEVKLSELNNEHRIDAEYFSKENLLEIKRLSEFGTLKIGDIAEVTDGIHTSIDYDENSRVNLISATSPKENVFDLSRGAFISEKAHAENPRTALRKNDVIISTVGTIGNCAVVDDSILPANSDRHVGIVRISNDYSPYVLSTFLLSKYGRMQTLRESTGNVQLNLFIYKLRELQIPNFSNDFQQKIESLVKSAHAKLSESKSLYAQAEDALLSELGLKDWQPTTNSVNIKQLKESFLKSGRLDAEYYQTKYEDYDRFLKSYRAGYGEFESFCSVNESNFVPQKYTEYKYIELGNISTAGEITGCTVALGSDLPSRARQVVRTNDVILSSVEGSLQSVALVTADYDNALCSTGFYVVKSEVINPETLLVLFKSEPMQNLFKQACSGTILTAINRTELKKITVPKIRAEIQTEIAECVQKSIALRSKAKSLLEDAKSQVENTISMNGGGYSILMEQSLYYWRLAEWLLLSELYADIWQSCSGVNCAVKRFSDFARTGRLDAEYYQPKYDEIENAIKSYKGGYDLVKNQFSQNIDVCDYSKKAYNYIEIGDINTGDGSVSYNLVETEELPDNAKRVAYFGDILISKVRPYRGAVAIINFETKNLIASGAFTTLHEKSDYKKEVLQVLLRTQIYKEWLLKWNVGSSYPVIKDEDILNLPIPILPQETQKQIAELIQTSFALRQESKQLLESAKLAVEAEIER